MRRMNIGSIVDYCIENTNQRERAEKDAKKGGTTRRATQADWSAFLG